MNLSLEKYVELFVLKDNSGKHVADLVEEAIQSYNEHILPKKTTNDHAALKMIMENYSHVHRFWREAKSPNQVAMKEAMNSLRSVWDTYEFLKSRNPEWTTNIGNRP